MPKQILLVVGGSRGIGAAISRHAAASGYFVVLTYAHGETEALKVVRDIEAAGARYQSVDESFNAQLMPQQSHSAISEV